MNYIVSKNGMVGKTYYSPTLTNPGEVKNFLLDPEKYLGNVENFIAFLTKDFFEGFYNNDGTINKDSVTLIEINEALKNTNLKFIPVIFPDFKWEDKTYGKTNKDILIDIWGMDKANRIIGSMPIPYVFQYKEQVFECIYKELNNVDTQKKVVVFDFDGTLTKPELYGNTWELLWINLGYDISECEKYHRMFSNKEITHDEWCEITEKRFKEAKCNKNLLKQLASKEEVIDDVESVILDLNSKGILLYILSGSIKQYIEFVLGSKISKCFQDIKANRFVFDDQGYLDGIIGTPYDFQGKAKFISHIIEEKHIDPQEILYVGNSFNDEFVYETNVETLCVNPLGTDFYNNKIWHNYIRKFTSLKEILPFVFKKEEK